MSSSETTLANLKINRGTYQAILNNLSSIGENEFVLTTDKTLPTPTINDEGKLVTINAYGEYVLADFILSNTTAYWDTQTSYIPPNKQLIVYNDRNVSGSTNIPGLKIGDGNSYVVDLPFIDQNIVTQLQSHINNTTVHITSAERTAWNNKITCDDTVADEELILTRNN